jgi:hypothetical protein
MVKCACVVDGSRGHRALFFLWSVMDAASLFRSSCARFAFWRFPRSFALHRSPVDFIILERITHFSHPCLGDGVADMVKLGHYPRPIFETHILSQRRMDRSRLLIFTK